jgi:cell division protein FtsL
MRVIVSVAMVTTLVMVYLFLLAKATQLNYELVSVAHQRVALETQTTQLRDRLSILESRERLLHIARQLGMTEPRAFTVVDLPSARDAQRPGGGLALLWSVRDWLK